ncbi:cytosine permease, partial [Bacillus sp. SIMBA_033]
IVAGFQLGWAPYVSDYSRYLPARVGVRATFWWTYLPSGLSAIWVFVVGAVTYAAAGPDATPVLAFKEAADSLFGGLGGIVVLGLLFGLLSV